jgi:hypothetical protein
MTMVNDVPLPAVVDDDEAVRIASSPELRPGT